MIAGLMRVRNEERWIARAVDALRAVTNPVIVLDDHSTDRTAEIAEEHGATVVRSPFDGLDEKRDKDYLLDLVYARLMPSDQTLGHASPHWAIMLDGDEELMADDARLLIDRIRGTDADCLMLRILYLWDADRQVRTDGVYGRFWRHSAFRLLGPDDRFAVTSAPGNLHCSSAPMRAMSRSERTAVRVLHYGYMRREDRIRKYEHYRRIDPGNTSEDDYRHMVIGDLLPAHARCTHGGPLRLEALR